MICLRPYIGSAMVLLLITTALSCAATWDFNPGQEAVKHKHELKDDVQGYGYFVEHKKINTNNLSLLEYAHGSGTLDFADILSDEQKTDHTNTYWVIDYDTGLWTKKPGGANSAINYTRQYENIQSPTSFAYGTGWYASHPVTYNSLLKDKTEAKSYQEAVAIERQVEYARGLKGDIYVNLNCSGPTEKDDGIGTARVNIDDYVTQGTLHVSELVSHTLKSAAKNPKLQGWRNPTVDVDNNYIGDFHVQKELKVSITKPKAKWMEDWLPCCSGGFFDIPSFNFEKERVSQKGVFDCTCRNQSISTFKPKWDATEAQFPTTEYQYKP